LTRNTLILVSFAALAAVFGPACNRRIEPLSVGSTAATDRAVIAEVAAQVLEKKLETPVTRRFEIAGTSVAYESLMLGTVNVYPEELNAFLSTILKEPVDVNPSIVYERVRSEAERSSRITVLKPLGVSGRAAVVIRATDQKDANIHTLSEAAKSKLKWTLAYSTEFEARSDGYTALMSTYNLPLSVPPKTMIAPLMYPALADNQLSMIVGRETDGPLAGDGFAVLTDDRNALRDSPVSMFVGPQVLERDARIRQALESLQGKFTNEAVRKLAYKVVAMKRNLHDVAAEFIRESGL
jgi:osmoprotectant transport system permease protein